MHIAKKKSSSDKQIGKNILVFLKLKMLTPSKGHKSGFHAFHLKAVMARVLSHVPFPQ